ncbi:hypothetical protein Z043_121072 [Scleropages formosus]|uniref:PLAC domain-containing protein n=1 Tax=Scleropages formosus TaxID=113540 RepID=A0A0P7TJ38_SCLFO|nr:hypothetical protein Z043_121072 [Scleropages formosus]
MSGGRCGLSLPWILTFTGPSSPRQYEGCDGVLGSGLVRDKCGICGGRDTSCRRVTGSFRNSSVPVGYHHILDIPPGATAINITERKASPNYLALRSGTGQSVVNGRWAVDPPGEYKAGGTTFLYSRPRAASEGQEGGLGETLTAPGPTTTLLQLFIIHHRKNPGIDYEFYIPVEKKESERGGAKESDGVRAPLREISALTVTVADPIPAPPPPVERRWSAERSHPRGSTSGRNARIPPRTDLPLDTQSPFVWRWGGLTECSASCGKGFQQRVIYCVNRYTEQEVSERKCDSAAKPAAEEIPCNLHPCPPFWEMGPWSECSVSCGPGVQQRQLQCRQSFGNRSTMVHPQRCSLLPRPNATQPCHPRICSRWEIRTNWSSCSVDCGVGKRTRSVRCVSDQGNVVSDRECNARLRPQGSEDCHMGPCITNWYFTDWTETCSAQCGPGVQRREVLCLSSGAGRDGVGGDCVGEKPADMKACNGGPCVSTTMWYTGPWGQCSALCGNGTQRRDIICVTKLGNEFNVTHASQCAHLEKPSPVQTCKMEPCRSQWFTTQWSAVSVPRAAGRDEQDGEKKEQVLCRLDHVRLCTGVFLSLPPRPMCSARARVGKAFRPERCGVSLQTNSTAQPVTSFASQSRSSCATLCHAAPSSQVPLVPSSRMSVYPSLAPWPASDSAASPCTAHPSLCTIPVPLYCCTSLFCPPSMCAVSPCSSPSSSDENCRDRHHNCMMVVQARLCVYSYYKTACCASCTQSAQRAKRH